MQVEKRRKKILHILYSGLGGHGNVLFSLTDADHEHDFEYECLFYGNENIRKEYIKMAEDRSIPWYFVKKNARPDIVSFREIMKIIRSAKPDILFLHASTYLLPVKLATSFSFNKRKIIIRETQANQLKNKSAWFWLRFAMIFAGKIVFLSNEYKEEVKKRLNWIYNDRKIQVIPNGINLEIFKPVERRSSAEKILGMQSRLVSIKDHITLFEAFSILLGKLPHSLLKLKVAGDGDYRKVLEDKVSELHIEKNVEFTGVLNEKELISFIQDLDIYIHASFGETMSTAIMQAMACKKTIIASDVPGINNMLIHNETGWLVPLKDPGAMADAMLKLLQGPDLAHRLAGAAYRFAQDHYSNEVMFKRYKELFNS